MKTIQITDKTGPLIAIKAVKEDDQLMIINRSGLTIRMDLSEMRVLGRATQGVRLIDLRKGDSIAAVARVDASLKEDIDETARDGENGNGPEPDNGQVGENGTEID